MERTDNTDFIREEVIKIYNDFNLEIKDIRDGIIKYKYIHHILNDFSDIYIMQNDFNFKYKIINEFRGELYFPNNEIKESYINRALYIYNFYFKKDNIKDIYYLESDWLPRWVIGKAILNMVIISNDFSNYLINKNTSSI
jgi:hypothetical protein